jgi:uncharacterized phage protein (predicted DNA packaging)
MTEPVSLSDMKAHLRLDADDTGEDTYLSAMIVAARRSIELQINRSLADPDFAADDVIVVAHAIRLMVGSWYANREAVITGTIVTEMPMGVAALLRPLWRVSAPPLP